MARPNAIIIPEGWSKNVFHGSSAGTTRWRVLNDGFILRSSQKPRRTLNPKSKKLASTVWLLYREHMRHMTKVWPEVTLPTLVATACNESAGDQDAQRHEAHLRDWSYGLCQLLTEVAFYVGNRIGWPKLKDGNRSAWMMPRRPVPRGGTPEEWARFLGNPYVNIALCAALHHINNERLDLRGDPVLMYAAYNSGGVYQSTKNAFGLHYHPAALDAFELFHNDAVAAISATSFGPVGDLSLPEQC